MKFLRFFAILVTNSHFLRPVLLLKPLLHRFHGKFSTFLLKQCETKTCEIPHCDTAAADHHLILADHGLSSKRWTNLASALRPLVRPQSNLDAIPARVSLWNELHNCVKSLPQNSHWKRLISRKNVSSKCDGGVTIWSNATVSFQTKFLQRLIRNKPYPSSKNYKMIKKNYLQLTFTK